jgi:hypothetical protein
METALAALIILTVVLYGAVTVIHDYLSAQDAIMTSWREMEERLGERARTDISPLGAETQSAGAIVEVILRNEGDTKLADFDQWDVIVQYYRASGQYLINWLPYTEVESPGDNEWTVAGIYLSASEATPEVYEPGILNPGEEMVIRMKVKPPVGPATTNLATIATPNGVSATAVFTG